MKYSKERIFFKIIINILLNNNKFKIFRAAIWRFKEENRALMRRMYGDMESTSVYREMRQMSTNMDDEEQDSSRKSSLVYTGSGFMPDLFSG